MAVDYLHCRIIQKFKCLAGCVFCIAFIHYATSLFPNSCGLEFTSSTALNLKCFSIRRYCFSILVLLSEHCDSLNCLKVQHKKPQTKQCLLNDQHNISLLCYRTPFFLVTLVFSILLSQCLFSVMHLIITKLFT